MEDSSNKSDVLIIGAGIVGLSTASFLKELSGDKSVRVLERNDRIGSLKTASSVNCGILCDPAHYYTSPLK